MHPIVLTPALLATLLAGCNRAAQDGHSEEGAHSEFGRPTVYARGEGERRMMRGTRPLFIVADPATVGARALMAGSTPPIVRKQGLRCSFHAAPG
jgi:hypothetical protein